MREFVASRRILWVLRAVLSAAALALALPLALSLSFFALFLVAAVWAALFFFWLPSYLRRLILLVGQGRITVKSGFFLRRESIIPLFSVTLVRVYRLPLIGRLGICTLIVNTVGHRTILIAVDTAAAEEIKNVLDKERGFWA